MTADDAEKRSLIRSVLSVHIMAHMTFLGGIGALHAGRLHTTLGRIPGNLVRDATQIGGSHICIHGTSLETHGCYGKLFIGKLTPVMVLETAIDGPIDLLPHVT